MTLPTGTNREQQVDLVLEWSSSIDMAGIRQAADVSHPPRPHTDNIVVAGSVRRGHMSSHALPGPVLTMLLAQQPTVYPRAG